MEKNNQKTTKIKTSKGKIAGRIMGIVLAILMLLSVCAPCVFYAISYFGA